MLFTLSVMLFVQSSENLGSDAEALSVEKNVFYTEFHSIRNGITRKSREMDSRLIMCRSRRSLISLCINLCNHQYALNNQENMNTIGQS